ncbi:hypothetical protein V2I01_16275 [Micromonospora sp. BRA006-A]|nr:hypothetical protein [Micromonospora sp. BRA006-A]
MATAVQDGQLTLREAATSGTYGDELAGPFVTFWNVPADDPRGARRPPSRLTIRDSLAARHGHRFARTCTPHHAGSSTDHTRHPPRSAQLPPPRVRGAGEDLRVIPPDRAYLLGHRGPVVGLVLDRARPHALQLRRPRPVPVISAR